jgi:hypothetical protein
MCWCSALRLHRGQGDEETDTQGVSSNPKSFRDADVWNARCGQRHRLIVRMAAL